MNPRHLRIYAVRPTLQRMGMWSHPAEDLLMGTAAVESGLGEFIVQHNNGPALGIFQIEPTTAEDIVLRYLGARQDLGVRLADVCSLFPNDTKPLYEMRPDRIKWKLTTDLAFQIGVARLKYWMSPDRLPADKGPGYVSALGCMWKNVYNTRLGSGTVQKFVENYWLTQG